VYASWGSYVDALARERAEQLKLLHSQDVMEGVLAWMQKREPNFTGK
jgi:2-(1,2-epoxy-1,2-dihydrophenyl)acetyl-CoA isomerase